MEEQTQVNDWTPTSMLEITLKEPDDFLKVRETLTRIGVASRKENKLFQYRLCAPVNDNRNQQYPSRHRTVFWTQIINFLVRITISQSLSK